MILIKESFKNPEILKSNELTKNEANLNLIFEKDKKKFNKNFSEYFIRYGDYGKIYLKKIKRDKAINKVNELIVFSILHPKLNELSEKEREINYAMYQEYKKLYHCKE
ncbi:hypothetical protein [Chryseobacterium tongliaoense]|uniref:hypothetical protein n=1 Tax=Chryseobacterium tongliaoense TaxID=3240933 RepID=UPI0035163F8E